MLACAAERAEAGQGGIEAGGADGHAGAAALPWVGGAEHGFAQVAVGAAPVGQPVAFAGFRAGQGLFGAVVDAGNAEAEGL